MLTPTQPGLVMRCHVGEWSSDMESCPEVFSTSGPSSRVEGRETSLTGNKGRSNPQGTLGAPYQIAIHVHPVDLAHVVLNGAAEQAAEVQQRHHVLAVDE